MDFVKEWWGVAVGIITGIVWLVRLEGKVSITARELLRMEKQLERDRADAKASRSETNEMLKEIREDNKEIRNDIKMLIGRGHVQHWNDRTIPPRQP